jgi:hypothetical protein
MYTGNIQEKGLSRRRKKKRKSLKLMTKGAKEQMFKYKENKK